MTEYMYDEQCRRVRLDAPRVPKEWRNGPAPRDESKVIVIPDPVAAERWLDLPQHRGVQVSSRGRLSCLFDFAPARAWAPWLVSVEVGENGHLYTQIPDWIFQSWGQRRRVDRLIASAFLARPDARRPCVLKHLNGDLTDCRLDNLSWQPDETFEAPRVLPDLPPKPTPSGERNGRARLSEAQVAEIRRMLAAGETCTTIAHRFGVSRSSISLIKSGRRWKEKPNADE
jgi:hypothetical protein